MSYNDKPPSFLAEAGQITDTFCDDLFSSCTIMGDVFEVETQPLSLLNNSADTLAIALVVSSPANKNERDAVRDQLRKVNDLNSLSK